MSATLTGANLPELGPACLRRSALLCLLCPLNVTNWTSVKPWSQSSTTKDIMSHCLTWSHTRPCRSVILHGAQHAGLARHSGGKPWFPDIECCIQLTASAGSGSPVTGAIGAVQAGQAAPGTDLMRELTGLVEAGMDVACFDLSQGLLEQHLDLADHLTEVGQPCLQRCLLPCHYRQSSKATKPSRH